MKKDFSPLSWEEEQRWILRQTKNNVRFKDNPDGLPYDNEGNLKTPFWYARQQQLKDHKE